MHSEQTSQPAPVSEEADQVDEAALARVMRSVPLGAAVLAGSAVALLVLGYLLIYIFVFIPRGSVGWTHVPDPPRNAGTMDTANGVALGVRRGGFHSRGAGHDFVHRFEHGPQPSEQRGGIDPKALHLSGEFAEHNLGTTVAADGSVTVRAIATQFMFLPHCIAVPSSRRVTLRFLITGRDSRTADHRHQRQYDGRAWLCRAGAHRVHPHRRSANALSRVLRIGAQRDVATVQVLPNDLVQAGSGREDLLCATLIDFVLRISGRHSRFRRRRPPRHLADVGS